MKELSLNILDIAENSVKAGAELMKITIDEQEDILALTIEDNGCGMPPDILKCVTDPFYTTRTTRKVGMGLPLLKMEAEQTGGKMEIASTVADNPDKSHGTTVKAVFNKKHIDFTPLGDVSESIVTLIQGHPDSDFMLTHKIGDRKISLDTRELRQELEGIPLNCYEVICWIREYLNEQYSLCYSQSK